MDQNEEMKIKKKLEKIYSKWKISCCGLIYPAPDESKFCLECGESLLKIKWFVIYDFSNSSGWSSGDSEEFYDEKEALKKIDELEKNPNYSNIYMAKEIRSVNLIE